jgi:hypothetical protein
MIGPLILRLMLAWQRHTERRDLRQQRKDACCG